ncbi:MAG: class I SAM-dependent methyltransferase [Spirochaetaceae bacterium]|jgi:2-polyprenyl-3-methyl-5-hydroxy-6-metoxy-1,4-benzoquinol methylase|nr:class I SAM-dependent methyltransferase [Spirochaetaceae bacterium]
MKAVFDEYYKDYDSWYDTPAGAFVDALETECAFSLLQPAKGMRILDAGCGTGNYSVKLARMGALVTGIDISPAMLKLAEEKKTQNNLAITFIQADCETAAFDGCFDGIISMAVFEFLANPAGAYANLKQYLKPGAPFVIGTIQKGGAWQKLYTSSQFKDSVYAGACFLSREDVESFDRNGVAASRECLYIPPGEKEYTIKAENTYRKKTTKGGFLCVKFLKK